MTTVAEEGERRGREEEEGEGEGGALSKTKRQIKDELNHGHF